MTRGCLGARHVIRATLGEEEGFFTPGSLFRIAADEDSPLAAGVGSFAWAMHLGGYVMRSPDPANVALRYPPAGGEDFFMSGEADGEAALGGTAAVIDERAGAGRIVSFGFEPNFRAFTDGTQRIVYNAMFGGDPAAAATARAAVRGRAAVTARRLQVVREPLRIVVRPRGARLVRRAPVRAPARPRAASAQRARRALPRALVAPTANAGGPSCVGPPPVANQEPGPAPEVTDHALVAGVGSVLPAASVALTWNTCLPRARSA
jgi:hypothetical protein